MYPSGVKSAHIWNANQEKKASRVYFECKELRMQSTIEACNYVQDILKAMQNMIG